MDDQELDQLLKQWHAPNAPPSLAKKVLPHKTPWWNWLFAGSIRIPVPVALVLVVTAFGIWFYESSRPPTQEQQAAPGSVSLADFQPVRQLEPRIARRPHEG